jgi:uncharacterized protein YcbK (DUF882 family)
MTEYKYFKREEFTCKETGENLITKDFILQLDKLREACGFPFVIKSGYRSPRHSVEAKKDKPGTHAQGIAADIKVNNGAEAYIVMREAFKLGFSGIALGKGFVHVDTRPGAKVSWTY